MTVKPAPRVAAALTRTAAQYRMRITPEQIRILAGTACDEIARAELTAGVPAPNPFLTSHQLMLLKLAAKGLSNEEIGAITCRSINTIKSQIRRILEQLGARDKGQAVAIALVRGFLAPTDVRVPPGQARRRPGPKPGSRAA